jgi:hypothetical protein
MSGEPLKIGVMLNSLIVPAWVHRVLADISKADFLVLSLVILNGEVRKASFSSKVRRIWPVFLFEVYQRLDQWLFSWKQNNAFSLVDVSECLGKAEIIKVVPNRTGYRHKFAAEDVKTIRSRDLDVILRLGFNILSGDILRSAKYGIWSLHHGDERVYRGGPALFWEIYERNPLSGSALQILTEAFDGGRIIYRSQSSTLMYSLFRNRNPVYWKSADFMMRRFRDLHGKGRHFIDALPTGDERASYNKRIYTTPGNLEMLPYLGRVAKRYAHERYSMLRYREQWLIAFRKKVIADCEVANFSLTSPPFTVITPPKTSYYADPFVVKKRGMNYVFFEEYSWVKQKGVISYITIDEQGHVSKPTRALERDYHLSYPMLFEWQGDHYMLPETRANKTIELYRAIEFPSRWRRVKVMFSNVEAVDSTVFEYAGRFWLFTNMSVSGGSSVDEVFLFYSGSPLGEWTPHAQNPVVSDVRYARPAGKLFWLNGSLIRPSQENSVRYGYGVNLNKIELLTGHVYSETRLKLLTPDWLPGNLKTHTFNFSDDLEVIDGLTLVRR